MDGARHPEWLGVLWSVGRALWEKVTPTLRYVSVGLVDRTVVVRMAYEQEPTPLEADLVGYFEAEVLADFHHLFETDVLAVARPVGTPPVFEDGTHWWAFMRYEGDSE